MAQKHIIYHMKAKVTLPLNKNLNSASYFSDKSLVLTYDLTNIARQYNKAKTSKLELNIHSKLNYIFLYVYQLIQIFLKL